MKITWNELTVPPGTHSSGDLLSEWRWLLGENYQILLISSLGDLFLADAAGHIHWLDAGAGRLSEIAASLDEFQQLRQQPANVNEWFVPQLVGDLIESGVTLAPGQCFSYKLPPLVGGQMELANFEATDLSVHFSIMGQISRQSKDFPDGTPIRSFGVTPPDSD
jgi:hypothetical protein